LLALAAVMFVVPASSAIFVCCAIGFGCAAVLLYRFGTETGYVRLTWVLACGLLLGYCGGTFVTQIIWGFAGLDAIAVTGVDKRYIAYGLMLVFLGCSSLLLGGICEAPLLEDGAVIEVNYKIERFLWLNLVLVATAYIHGDFSYSAVNQVGGDSKTSVLAALAMPGAVALLPLASIGFMQGSGPRRFRFGVLMFLGVAALVPISRRDVLYAAMISIFCVLRLSGRRLRISSLGKTSLSIILVLLLIFSNIFFFGLRMAADQDASKESGHQATLTEGFYAARNGIFRNPKLLIMYVGENLEKRAYVIGYLSLLARGGRDFQPMMGSDAVLGMEMTIPDALYELTGTSKAPIRTIGAEEGLANEHFGLNVTDEANSILTGGFIDFGVIGVLFYPLALCGLFRWYLLLISKLFSPEVSGVILILVLSLIITTEQELRVDFIAMRDFLILAIICAIAFAVPRISRGRQAVPLFPQVIPTRPPQH
jgi:hypothetical protein